MPCSLSEIVTELDRLLEPTRFQDYCPNGLQVPGRERVDKVATGVSAHAELFRLARAEQADLIVVHHGIFWGSGPQSIDTLQAGRLKLLFDAEMSLAAYHLPLDAHPQLGNNALIAQALGGQTLQPFGSHHAESIGFVATFSGDGVSSGELFARVQKLTGREPLIFDSGPAQVRSIAVVSGAGASYLDDAVAAGVDAFLTGEPAERVMAQASEAGMHFIAAGHYATETFGVRRLGEYLSEHFGLEHVFIDVPNPV
jgi:dinuclear metal center YbgI/SA1388 family protein